MERVGAKHQRALGDVGIDGGGESRARRAIGWCKNTWVTGSVNKMVRAEHEGRWGDVGMPRWECRVAYYFKAKGWWEIGSDWYNTVDVHVR